jgi:hypothetical protein
MLEMLDRERISRGVRYLNKQETLLAYQQQNLPLMNMHGRRNGNLDDEVSLHGDNL